MTGLTIIIGFFAAAVLAALLSAAWEIAWQRGYKEGRRVGEGTARAKIVHVRRPRVHVDGE